MHLIAFPLYFNSLVIKFFDLFIQFLLIQSKNIRYIIFDVSNLINFFFYYGVVIIGLFMLYIIISHIHYIIHKNKENLIFTYKEFLFYIFKFFIIILVYSLICYLLLLININNYLINLPKYEFLSLIIIWLLWKFKNFSKDNIKLYFFNIAALIILRSILIFILPNYLSKYLSINIFSILFPEILLFINNFKFKLEFDLIPTLKNKVSKVFIYNIDLSFFKKFSNFFIDYIYIPMHIDIIKKLINIGFMYITELERKEKIKLNNFMERPSEDTSSSSNTDTSSSTDNSNNISDNNSIQIRARKFLWDWIKKFDLPLENYHYGSTRCVIKDEMFEHPMTKETALALTDLCGRRPIISPKLVCFGYYYDNYSKTEVLGEFSIKGLKYTLGKGDFSTVSVFVPSNTYNHKLPSDIVVQSGYDYEEYTYVKDIEIKNFKSSKEIVAIGPNTYLDNYSLDNPKVLGTYDPLDREHAWVRLGVKVPDCKEEDSKIIGKGVFFIRDEFIDGGTNNSNIRKDVNYIYGWGRNNYKACNLGKEN